MPPIEEFSSTFVVSDIEGNQREVIDAKGPHRRPQRLRNAREPSSTRPAPTPASDGCSAKRGWESIPSECGTAGGQIFRTEYDRFHRPARVFVTGADPNDPGQEQLHERFGVRGAAP